MNQPSLKKNFFLNALLALSSFLFPLITFQYASRVLGPAGYGRVAFAASFVSYFNMVAQLGIPTYGIRACAAVRDDRAALTKLVQELLLINLLMGMVSYFALGVCALTIPRVAGMRPLILIFSATILLNALGMEWLYQALEQYAYITVRSLVFKAISLIALFLLVHRQEDLLLYAGIALFASSASNIINFVHARKYISLRPVGGFELRRHWKAVAVFFAMACATTIYASLDEVMLGFMKTDADVGYYQAAVKIKTILVSLVTALGAVLLPRASYYIDHGLTEDFRRVTGKALRFVLLAAPPLMLYFMLYAREGIDFLSGSAYAPSVLPMQILMPTLLLIGITNVLGIQMLIPLGREKTVLYSEIAGAVTDLVLNALLIPRYAATGAAIGTLAAELVVLLVQYSAMRAEVRDPLRRVSLLRLLGALAVACAAGLWVKLLPLGSFASLAISAVCFFAAYLIFLLVSREELTTELWSQLLDRLRQKVRE